jgi:hypothetical protein
VSVAFPGSEGLPGLPGLPGGDPLETGTSSQNGDSDNGDIASTEGGSTNSNGTSDGTQGGDGQNSSSNGNGSTNSGSSSGDDPFADLANGRGGVMTASERRATLDARLEESYEVFDGMILSEREQAQNEANAAGSGGGGGGNGEGSGSESSGTGNGSIVVASGSQSSTGGGFIPPGQSREGDFSNQTQESFPIPEDIPSGNNDDVVARQLREAAMSEADPELREALWDEYRSYTGLSQ